MRSHRDLGVLSGALSFVALGAFVACSSSSSSEAPPATNDAGADAAPQGTPFTVWVYDDALEPKPIAGATVAWDPPGGGARVEVQTEADGKAIVYGDFTSGAGTLSAHVKDRIVTTLLDASPKTFGSLPYPPLFGKPKTDAVIILPRVDATTSPELVELSGTFKNKTEPGTAVLLGAGGNGKDWSGTTSQPFTVKVPKDKPYALMGCEFKVISQPPAAEYDYKKCFRFDQPAQAGAATLDIDLAAVPALPTKRVKQKVELPGGAAGPFGGANTFVVSFALGSGLPIVTIAKTTPSGDTVESDANVLDTDLAGETVISQAALQNPDGTTSVVTEPGLPAEGRVFKDFVLPTPVTIEKMKITDPLPLDGFPDGTTDTELIVDLQSNVQSVWYVFRIALTAPGGKAGSPLTLPAPPSTFKVPASLQGRILVRRGFTPTGEGGFGYGKQISVSRVFQVEK